jgi:hypothetical protein
MPAIWDNPLTDEQRETIIRRVSEEISKRKLETPAILFLEMHKPLANIAAHAMIAVSPFVMPFFGFRSVDEYSQFVSDRRNIELLIQRLENKEEPKEVAS